MVRITKVYTRTGDDGSTSLGTGARVAKTHPRVVVYGLVDELGAVLGLVLASSPARELVEPLRRIQNLLFHLGADLCVPEADKASFPGPRITPEHVQDLEDLMDRLSEHLPALESFILAGGSLPAAHLHVARTRCRTAERALLHLAESEGVRDEQLAFLNRLSDALFVMARYQNHTLGIDDPLWDSRA